MAVSTFSWAFKRAVFCRDEMGVEVFWAAEGIEESEIMLSVAIVGSVVDEEVDVACNEEVITVAVAVDVGTVAEDVVEDNLEAKRLLALLADDGLRTVFAIQILG